jgi:predicted DNA binding CopG/RHH family protein
VGKTPHIFACHVLPSLVKSWRMARKPVAENKRAKAAGISLPSDLIRAARKAAFQQGMSLSSYVRVLLMKKLNGEAA